MNTKLVFALGTVAGGAALATAAFSVPSDSQWLAARRLMPEHKQQMESMVRLSTEYDGCFIRGQAQVDLGNCNQLGALMQTALYVPELEYAVRRYVNEAHDARRKLAACLVEHSGEATLAARKACVDAIYDDWENYRHSSWLLSAAQYHLQGLRQQKRPSLLASLFGRNGAREVQ